MLVMNLDKLKNDESKLINWKISKSDLNIIYKSDFFSFKSGLFPSSKYIVGRKYKESNLYCYCGCGGSGKTNFLISFASLYNLNVAFGKNINEFGEKGIPINQEIIIIDSINEINVDLETFFKYISSLNKMLIISYRDDLPISSQIANLIKKYFNGRHFINKIDDLISFDYERVDLHKVSNNEEKLAFIMCSKLLKNKRNIHFLYSLIINKRIKTNQKNVIGILRDLIEQFFKIKNCHDLWNKLKHSKKQDNNLFIKLNNIEKKRLIGVGFNYKDNHFEIEDIFHCLIDENVWSENSHLELSEYANAIRSIRHDKSYVFTDLKQYLLFCCCHFYDVKNLKAIKLKTQNVSIDLNEWWYLVPFFKHKKLTSFTKKNIQYIIDFYVNFVNVNTSSMEWSNFCDYLVKFNKNNFVFLFSLFLLKHDEIALEISNKFIRFFRKLNENDQIKVLNTFVVIINFIFAKIKNYKYGSKLYYIFSRFALLLRKVNSLYKFKKIKKDIFKKPPRHLLYTHSWEGIFTKNFALDIKRNTYFWKIRNKNCEDLLFTHKFKFSEHFNSYFDHNVSHNRPLIESKPMQTPRKGKWKIVDEPVISKTFCYWLNTEPLFKKLDIKDGKYTELGYGYPDNNVKSYWTFENDDEAYIIDVLWYYLSIPRKKSNPNSYYSNQCGIYHEQYHFINNPFDSSWDNKYFKFKEFNFKWNNTNFITYANRCLTERIIFTLQRINKIIKSKEIIFLDETIGGLAFNLYIIISFSNEENDAPNNNIYLKGSDMKYCYQQFDGEIFYNDESAKYYYDNLHKQIIVSKNKDKYKNYKCVLSICNEHKWVEIIGINDKWSINLSENNNIKVIQKALNWSELLKKIKLLTNLNS